MRLDVERVKTRLQEISKKNEVIKEYSLGDVLLLNKFEKELEEYGYAREEIEALSPSYYNPLKQA
jgi:hypothetical protein